MRRITADWLTKKFGSVPLASGHHQIDARSTLTTQVVYDDDGAEKAFRLQLRQDEANATWRTTVTAVASEPTHPNAAVSVVLEAFPNPGHTVTPARPALVRDLVEALHPRDGLARLTLHAQEVGTDLDHLLHVLCDQQRTLPVIVAARPLRPDALWSTRMRKTMPQCAGAASLYLLRDAAAVDAFREQIGEHHRVAPGAVRTFLPDVDPAWAPDASRHRFLSSARMCNPADSSWFGIARRAHQMASRAPLPPALHAVSFPDVAQTHQAERQAALTVDRPVGTSVVDEEIALLTGLLGQADADLKEAARNAELADRTIDALQTQLDAAATVGLRDIEDALTAWDEVERLRAEADVLRRRLHSAGRSEDTVVLEELPGSPQSFEELWERLVELPGVLVTADRDKALALDESDRARVWAAKAWNGLRALNSYALTPAFNGSFYQFCTSGIPGTVGWPHKQLATSESKQTMDRWGDERVFPVPEDVDPSGQAEMKPHLKLDNGGMAPRIHFLDATGIPARPAQMIVGYIGTHLTNTRTN
ncbi:hypothetical protein ACFC1T_36550 [Kitasatospora sp. NPDC056076]|uniref:hypothetical protein n=1 Tax=Kitasatospora sp. NPDC056076 TaxID=3345703 RepID=UPI0035DFE18A